MTFGNDPAKLDRYRAFWSRGDASRPLTGFTLAGWFPLREFAACRPWQQHRYLEPGMISPADFLDDHLRMLGEGEAMDDDMIRGALPGQLAFPWLAGMVGCKVRILPSTVVGEEANLDWDRALAVRLDPGEPWYRKYMEYADALVELAAGRFPVSHSAEIGPTDLHAVLRGHTSSLIDLADQPEKSGELLARLGEIFREATDAVWRHLPLYQGGYFDAQYSLWAPGRIVRMQEDATAVYSPRFYRRFVQPVDREIARHYESAFIHLHSTSMFLLDDFLEIEEIRCFEVNLDALGPGVAAMIPCFERIQRARRPLLIKGSATPDELKMLAGRLEARGLFLNVMVESMAKVEPLRRVLGM